EVKPVLQPCQAKPGCTSCCPKKPWWCISCSPKKPSCNSCVTKQPCDGYAKKNTCNGCDKRDCGPRAHCVVGWLTYRSSHEPGCYSVYYGSCHPQIYTYFLDHCTGYCGTDSGCCTGKR